MYLSKITLRNLRGIQQANLDFQEKIGMYLLVGVNGVGKSSILDALRISLSKMLPKISPSRSAPSTFQIDDLRLGTQSIFADVSVVISNYVARQVINTETIEPISDNREAGKGLRSKRKKTQLIDENERDLMRQQVIESRDIVDLFVSRIETEEEKNQRIKSANEEMVVADTLKRPIDNLSNLQDEVNKTRLFPLAVYYSPHRSIIARNKLPKMGALSIGEALAYHEALSEKRTFEILQFAQWWRTWKQEASDTGDNTKLHALSSAFREVVSIFLPECSDLILDEEKESLKLTKMGKQVDVAWLSDGERSVLTLGLDLVRRLFIANPGSNSPREEGVALVLIDELDLHLHPRWQRNVVSRLQECFPLCQFIVSTHSPQIIGEVEPERISVIRLEENEIKIYSIDQAFGMDSNWILREIMDTDERDAETKEMLDKLFQMIARREVPEAQKLVEKLKERLNGDTAQLQQAAGTIQRIKAIGR